jgi:hypothetical protein
MLEICIQTSYDQNVQLILKSYLTVVYDTRGGGGGGAQLKKLRRAEGGATIFGVFRVKNHDFTPKNHIFSNCGGRHELYVYITICHTAIENLSDPIGYLLDFTNPFRCQTTNSQIRAWNIYQGRICELEV